jgi:L-lactate dehydrogenase complex protein LldG
VSAREAILRAVRHARPAGEPLPSLNVLQAQTPTTVEALVGLYIAAVRGAGADVVEAGPGDVDPTVRAIVAGAELGAVVCEGVLGVAENGAAWLPLSRLRDRADVFLADHVVIVLERATIVASMHEAYARIDVRAEVFGTFMAGPSKTADVEQSLVIGAHGPRRVTVLLRG